MTSVLAFPDKWLAAKALSWDQVFYLATGIIAGAASGSILGGSLLICFIIVIAVRKKVKQKQVLTVA